METHDLMSSRSSALLLQWTGNEIGGNKSGLPRRTVGQTPNGRICVRTSPLSIDEERWRRRWVEAKPRDAIWFVPGRRARTLGRVDAGHSQPKVGPKAPAKGRAACSRCSFQPVQPVKPVFLHWHHPTRHFSISLSLPPLSPRLVRRIRLTHPHLPQHIFPNVSTAPFSLHSFFSRRLRCMTVSRALISSNA